MLCSICLATHERPELLDKTLKSIFRQRPPFEFEVIVVDDGSGEEDTFGICKNYDLQYIRMSREAGWRNPAIARNVAYRRAHGKVIIAQSDDVIHQRESTIEQLVDELTPGHFVIATVINVDSDGCVYQNPTGLGYGDGLTVYTSPRRRRPLFFLGSLYRSDLYAVGGNDEEFTDPAGEDVWFGYCLTRGAGLVPDYSDVRGNHQAHQHTVDYEGVARSQSMLKRKLLSAKAGRSLWQSASGPWPLDASAPPGV